MRAPDHGIACHHHFLLYTALLSSPRLRGVMCYLSPCPARVTQPLHVPPCSGLTFQLPIIEIMCPMGPEIWTATSLRMEGMGAFVGPNFSALIRCAITINNYQEQKFGPFSATHFIVVLLYLPQLTCKCLYCSY